MQGIWRQFWNLVTRCNSEISDFLAWTISKPTEAGKFYERVLGIGNVDVSSVQSLTESTVLIPYANLIGQTCKNIGGYQAVLSGLMDNAKNEDTKGDGGCTQKIVSTKKEMTAAQRNKRKMMKERIRNHITVILESSSRRYPGLLQCNFGRLQEACNYLMGYGKDCQALPHQSMIASQPWVVAELLDKCEAAYQATVSPTWRKNLAIKEIEQATDHVVTQQMRIFQESHDGALSGNDSDNENQGSFTKKKQRKDVTNRVQLTHLGDLLVDNILPNIGTGVTLTDYTGKDLLVAATSLAYPMVYKCLRDCNLPLDQFFSAGRRFRESLGLPGTARSAGCPLSVQINPLLPLPAREGLVQEFTTKGFISEFCLAPMVLNILDGALTHHDCKEEAWNEHLNSLSFCRQNDSSYVRASVVRHDPEKGGCFPGVHGGIKTPVAHIGKDCILCVPASDPEVLFLKLKSQFANLIIDAINEQVMLLLNRPVENEGGWRKKYTTQMAQRRMGPYKNPISPEVYQEIVSKVSIGTMRETPPQVRRQEFNMSIIKKGKGFGPHSDGEAAMNSREGPSRIKKQNGVHLPTRKEMQVVTFVTCANSSKERSKAALYHYKRKGGSKQRAHSYIYTYHNSCHAQGTALQGGQDFVHASDSFASDQRLTDTARNTLDPLHEMGPYLNSLKEDGIPFNKLRSELDRTKSKGTTVYHCYNFTKVMTTTPVMSEETNPVALWWENDEETKSTLQKLDVPAEAVSS